MIALVLYPMEEELSLDGGKRTGRYLYGDETVT